MKGLQGWQLFALGSAFFAGLTAILGKLGVAGMSSNLATFIRTGVVLALAAGVVSLGRNGVGPKDWRSSR